MDRDATFQDAKRLYLEQYGDPMVTNTYLKIALALLSIVCVALALIDLRTTRTSQTFPPLSIASANWDAPRPSTTPTLKTSRRAPRQNTFSLSSAPSITGATATPFRMISRSPCTSSPATCPP